MHLTFPFITRPQIVLSGVVIKRRHFSKKMRLLVLTNLPRLFYIKASGAIETDTIKGHVPWSDDMKVCMYVGYVCIFFWFLWCNFKNRRYCWKPAIGLILSPQKEPTILKIATIMPAVGQVRDMFIVHLHHAYLYCICKLSVCCDSCVYLLFCRRHTRAAIVLFNQVWLKTILLHFCLFLCRVLYLS